jgi:hypothetical protein
VTAKRPGARPKAPAGEPLAFLARASVAEDSSECILWPYGKTEGYGALWYDGRKVGAHNLVLTVWDGPQPEDKEACHSCDNRACVNPLHLRWGTRQDNVNDMMARGRHWSQ